MGKAFRQCVIKDSSGFHFSAMASMAAYSAKMHVAASLSCRPKQVAPRFSGFKAVSFGQQRYAFTSLRSAPFNSRSLHILCAAKPETVSKVCEIVKSQLALSDDKTLTPESKF